MKILICNVGSTSLKYRLLDMHAAEATLALGKIERVGSPNSIFAHEDCLGNKLTKTLPIPDHGQGISLMLQQLVGGVVTALADIACVGFKVVHAKGVTGVQYLNKTVLAAMADFNCIAPAHNPPYIAAIQQFAQLAPGIPLIGSFETGFHATMPPKAYLYPIPRQLADKHAIRRYGFHGASHEYVCGKVQELMGKTDLKIITCHLGGSGSLCAIDGGKSVDTTLGFSLQTGIMHNNRCGDIDPYIPLYLQEELGFSLDQVKKVLNKESGFLGLSGLSGDLRDVEEAADAGNAQAQDCIDHYAYSIKKYIGAYAFALGGVDAIAFSGGIGENSPTVRRLALEGLEAFGIVLDHAKNQTLKCDNRLDNEASKVQIFAIATNEEIIVARKAMALLENS